MNPSLDLALQRIIRAPRAAVWRAWTDPTRFEKWWIPAPTRCRVERLDVRPGGALVTSMSEDGHRFGPHMDATFIAVDHLTRIVFTNVIDSDLRPANPDPIAMTAEVVLGDHPDGTDYRVVIRHGDPAARALHQKIGFADGWGSVTAQLASAVEGGAAVGGGAATEAAGTTGDAR